MEEGKYNLPHVSRPLGSTDEGHIYEFVPGSEGFPWKLFDGKRKNPVMLKEWNPFTGAFLTAGIDLSYDVSDVDDGHISKNIILYHSHKIDYDDPVIGPSWHRIDFGSKSLTVNYDKLEKFLTENKSKLIESLSYQRYGMMKLALKYLKKGPLEMDRRDIGKLEILVAEFRISSASHMGHKGKDLFKKCGVYPTEQEID